MPFHAHNLPNGLQLIGETSPSARSVALGFFVRTGSRDETPAEAGVSHYLEHMMFKGTPTTGPGEFSRKVAALGGRENAFTTRDNTGYYQQIPANRLEDVIRLESDRFAHNQWADDEFKRELEVVKEERRMRTEDNPRAHRFYARNGFTPDGARQTQPFLGEEITEVRLVR